MFDSAMGEETSLGAPNVKKTHLDKSLKEGLKGKGLSFWPPKKKKNKKKRKDFLKSFC